MKSRSTFRAYVTALLAPWIVGMKRILTDSNGYIQKSVDQVSLLSGEAQSAAADADASKSSAATSASSAQASAAKATADATTAAQTASSLTAMLRSFAKVWYGALDADPTKDANGDSPVIGAEYWNTKTNVIRVFTASGWKDQDAAAIADASNAALSASRAATYAAQAKTSADSASSSSTNAKSSAATSQDILNQMKALMPSFDATDAGFFFRISDDGTKYILSSPSDALTSMKGASLTSPNFAGLPTAPTAKRDTNTLQIATCGFVLNQASNIMPLSDGRAAIGTSYRYARADHVHPSDMSAVSGVYGVVPSQGDLAGIGIHYDAKDKLITVGFRPLGSTTGSADQWYNLASDENVIHTTGGQIVGNLTIGGVAAGTNSSLIIDGPLASERFITFRMNGNPHWYTGGDSTSLSGNNAGDNFVLGSYDDRGVRLRTNLTVNRQSGLAAVGGPLTCTSYGKVSTASGDGASFYIDKPSNFWGQVVFQTGGSTRWSIAVPGDESGVSGADFYIQSWNGSDQALDTPLRIYRNSGVVYMPRGVIVDGKSNTSTQGASNQSAYITAKLSSRNTLWSSAQYLEEIVGSKVRHVIKVMSSSSSYAYTFDEVGTLTAAIFNGRAMTANYGDLAEYYKIKDRVAKGTLVRIARDEDPDIDIEVAPKGSPFIFGVISTDPGLILNTKDKEKGVLVALTGQVPTRVIGPIYKGDPVSMSASKDGVASYGTHLLIGFAMETNLNPSDKLVMVAIGGRSNAAGN